MNAIVKISLLFVFLTCSSILAYTSLQPAHAAPEVAPVQTRTFFVENRGRHDGKVKYYLPGAHGSVFFTAEEVVFSFCRKEEKHPPRKRVKTTEKDNEAPDANLVFRFTFHGANAQPVIMGQRELPGKINYFVGSRKDWKTSIPIFEEVLYRGLYDGIDLVFSAPGNNLKYTMILSKGADISKVRFAYKSVDAVRVNPQGELVISTSFGDFVDSPPKVFRKSKGKSAPVKVRFRIIEKDCVGFLEI
ncbi:MAG: hypothetical protein SV487_06005 [Thermodesulfobacteriota bacterium]|nr:hypothetical protein [Thermodesulfobacteriota bacterium]